jgi:hypothetical protein
MSTFKPLKFTVCYRKTIFSFITIKFSEEDFINQLSDENKNYWNSITIEKRRKIWNILKKEFPFELGGEPLDPHNNWIEAWDEDINEETNESWDNHEYIKEEIINKVSDILQKEK